jgi:predicted neuraminidase
VECEFLYNPRGVGTGGHCASITQVPSGRLVCAWYGYPGPDDFREGRIVLTSREPSGRWRQASCIFPAGGFSEGNPVVWWDTKRDLLCLAFVRIKGDYWTDATIYFSTSPDEGRTWTTPTSVCNQRGMMVRHPPLRSSESDLLIPGYDERTNNSVLFSESSDEDWIAHKPFGNTPIIQPVLIREPSRLSTFFRPTSAPRTIWRSHSTNNGKVWSAPVQTSLACPLSGISAFAWKDSLFVVHNNTNEHQRHPLSLSYSSDNCRSWRTVDLDTIAHEISYPSFIIDDHGMVYGVYTYNRRMIKFVSFPVTEVLSGLN